MTEKKSELDPKGNERKNRRTSKQTKPEVRKTIWTWARRKEGNKPRNPEDKRAKTNKTEKKTKENPGLMKMIA